MQNQKEIRQFQVALLMDNISEAKDLSNALREMGIYAHFYSELDEFWVEANTQTPDLTIVDIKKMSHGTLLFKNHPKVLDESLCFAFYHKDETKILLSSTYGLNHYGYIKKEINLKGQIQNILKRRNEELHLIEKNSELQARVERLQKRSQKIINDAQISYNFENQFQVLNDIADGVGVVESKEDFIRKMGSILSEWELCVGYGVYHLTENGQKLISQKMSKPKYKELPELWLSKSCEDGIADYAMEMASEVSFDAISSKLRQIKIMGSSSNPDIIILARFDEDRLQDFQWNLLEERLSNTYKTYLLRSIKSNKEIGSSLSTWEAFSHMDDMYFHQARTNHKIVEVDFSRLLNTIKERHGNRFYWKSFFADFNEELTSMLTGDCKTSQYGVQSLMVFLDKSTLETDFQRLRHLVNEFQYFRYFEDSNLMMTQGMLPEIKAVTPSSVNFLRQVYSNIMSAGQVGESRRATWENQEVNI